MKQPENIETLTEAFETVRKQVELTPFEEEEIWAVLWEYYDTQQPQRWLN